MKKTRLAVVVVVIVVGYLFVKGHLGFWPVFYFDGGGTRFGGFALIPDDLGEECLSGADCEQRCSTTLEDVQRLACQPACFRNVPCVGIRGRCVFKGQRGLTIRERDTVRRDCDM